MPRCWQPCDGPDRPVPQTDSAASGIPRVVQGYLPGLRSRATGETKDAAKVALLCPLPENTLTLGWRKGTRGE
jgi:hypothetical protein